MKRKIIQLGGSAVVALPSPWLKEMNLGPGKEVSLSVLNDRLIVGRTEADATPIPYHRFDKTNVRTISAIVYAHYLGGRDGVTVEVPVVSSETYDHLEELCGKLSGASLYRHETNPQLILRFTDVQGKSILSSLDRCFNILNRMCLANLELLGRSYRDEERLETNKRTIMADEDELDRTKTYILRLLNKALYDPEFFYQTDIGDKRNVVQYGRIAAHAERLADLQEEIVGHLVRNYRDFIKNERIDFRPASKKLERMYLTCFNLVQRAHRCIRDPNESCQLVGLGKLDQQGGISYVEGIVERTQRESLFQFFLNRYSKCPEFLPEITILQSKIYAMASIALNIAECSANIQLSAGSGTQQ